MPLPYLIPLTERLTEGVSRLPTATLRRHEVYLRTKQRADGGWAGRQGESDLYYTAFALRALTILGALSPDSSAATANYLRQQLHGQTSLADFFSLLVSALMVQSACGADVLVDAPSDWSDRVTAALEALRTPDGGYTKTVGGTTGSTYQTFLIGLCYEMLDRDWPDSERVIGFVRSRQRDDGGFVEVPVMKRCGTNPTAAAVGILQCLGPLDAATRYGVRSFLDGMTADEGGYRANDRIPLADLLSTFTALWTLDQIDAWDDVDAAAIRRYAERLDQSEGGFLGGEWDEQTDVEYTFYGLGVLGLLAAHS